MAQPVQLVDRLCSSGRGPIVLVWSRTGWGRPKSFSLSQWPSLPGQGWTSTGWGPVEVRLRSGRGPVEAQRSLAKHEMLMASQPVDPQRLVWLFSSIKRLKYLLFQKFNLPKPFLNIFEHWKSVLSAPFNPSFLVSFELKVFGLGFCEINYLYIF